MVESCLKTELCSKQRELITDTVPAPALGQREQAQNIEMLQAFLKFLHGFHIRLGSNHSRKLRFLLQEVHGLPDRRLGDLACFRLQHLDYDPQEVAMRHLMDHGPLLPVQLDLTQGLQPLVDK